MTAPVTTDLAPLGKGMSAAVIETVLLQGDLAKLNPEGRVAYMTRVCETLGLNPLTKPFEFISLNGKLVMYAKKDCTEQLRRVHGVSLTIVAREVIEGVYVVTARAQDKTGRHDESTGAVSVEGLKGESRANALMKAETKAKRRVTLSICGLGMLDESEVETIPGATTYEAPSERFVAGGAAQQPPKAETSAADVAKGQPSLAPVSASHVGTPASAPSTKTDGAAKRPAANTIRHSGKLADAMQVKLIHTLRGKIGGLTVCTDKAPCEIGTSRACKYHQQLHAFKSPTGQPLTSSKDMSPEQADFLIDRYKAKIEQQAKTASQPIDIGPDTKDIGEELAVQTSQATTNPAEYADLVFDVCGVFGKDGYEELTDEQKAQALQLVLVAGDKDKWREAVSLIQTQEAAQ